MSLRVFELAKELNIPTRDLIKRIGKLEIKIKGNFSALTEEQIITIKKDFLESPTRIKETLIPAAEGVKKVRRRIISVKKAAKAKKIKDSLNISESSVDTTTNVAAKSPTKNDDAKNDDVKKESKNIIKAKTKTTTEKPDEQEVAKLQKAEDSKPKKTEKTKAVAEKEIVEQAEDKKQTQDKAEQVEQAEDKKQTQDKAEQVEQAEDKKRTQDKAEQVEQAEDKKQTQDKAEQVEQAEDKKRTQDKAQVEKTKPKEYAPPKTSLTQDKNDTAEQGDKAKLKEKTHKKTIEQAEPKEKKRKHSEDDSSKLSKQDKKVAIKSKTPKQLNDAVSKDKPNKKIVNKPSFKKNKNKSNTNATHKKQGRYPAQHLSKKANRKEKNKKQDNKKAKHTFNPRQKDLVVGEVITVGDLSGLIGVKAPAIIKTLMSLGIMATITQSIDGETAALVASEYGISIKVEYKSIEDSIEGRLDSEEQLTHRPPVVTIMGHVDHGKTSLLDKIRKSNVTEGEAGGITQHIGAYHVKTADGNITFLDTPGHEAFTEMRARGANVTDIVVLVIAADDGPRPQTIEAINHSKAAGVEIVVAINKCDKPEANPDRTIQELMKYEIVPEELGGNSPIIQVSAKTGEGIDKLLEMLHLQAEIMELKSNPRGPAKGVVIESRVDSKKGNIASILVRSGLLKVGDTYVAGTEYGRVRAMWNDQGKKITSASPSEPVEIAGLNGTPKAGDPFNVGADEKQVRQIAALRAEKEKEKKQAGQKKMTLENLFDKVGKNEQRVLNLIIKTDVIGSLEALTKSLIKLGNEKVSVNIIHDAVGAIVASDVLLASTSDAIIVGFNSRPDKSSKKMSRDENVEIRLYTVIYEIIEDVKKALEGMLEPIVREEIQGKAEVLHVFNIPKVGVVAGSKVTNGKILRDCSVRIIRDNVIIHNGKLASLKRFKDSAKEVSFGYECGISVESFKDLRVGDELESYLRLTTPAKL